MVCLTCNTCGRFVSCFCIARLKKQLINNIQNTIQIFQIWHNLYSELTSTWTFKMYPRYANLCSELTSTWTFKMYSRYANLCSELTSTWTFKMYPRYTKTTNEPTASITSQTELLIFFFNKDYYQESYILIIEYSG
jgi:hypothetical protein